MKTTIDFLLGMESKISGFVGEYISADGNVSRSSAIWVNPRTGDVVYGECPDIKSYRCEFPENLVARGRGRVMSPDMQEIRKWVREDLMRWVSRSPS